MAATGYDKKIILGITIKTGKRKTFMLPFEKEAPPSYQLRLHRDIYMKDVSVKERQINKYPLLEQASETCFQEI